MAFLGVDKDEFKKFKADVFAKLKELQERVDSTPSDLEQEAIASLENTKKLQANIEENARAVGKILQEIEGYKDGVQEEKDAIAEGLNNFKSNIESLNSNYDSLIDKSTKVSQQHSEISSKMAVVEQQISELQTLEKSINDLKSVADESEQCHIDIKNTLQHSLTIKSEIDDLYTKVFGRDIKNEETGELEHIDGTKEILEKSYTQIKKSIDNLGSMISETISSSNDDFEALLETSKKRYDNLDKEISSLLPGAMAAGLSSAYANKKTDEIDSLSKLEGRFRSSIVLLVLSSLIPVWLNFYLLNHGFGISDIIKDLPHTVILILPLYIPILWYAYSTSKKANLSKRLIEEYTHKEVIGKTFSGLAKQIDSLPQEGKIKEELRTQLLFNILQVSAENPGKLIKNYDKSDHPLMEVLESSSKLSNAVDNLSKIPGLGSLAGRLLQRAERDLIHQSEKVSRGLDVADDIEGSERNEKSSSP